MDINVNEIQQSYERIKDVVRHTMMTPAASFLDFTEAQVLFKCENMQKTGSFKLRGASNKIIKLKDQIGKDEKFVTASAGNHGQGLAYAATCLGFKSTIVMPKYAPVAKIYATRNYGADVELHGECFDDAYDYARSLDGIFVHPYDDIDVISGQGTIGLEILQDVPDVDMILVPAGGGGLLAGVASYVKQVNPKIKVIGVQASNANAIARSFQEKKKICTDTTFTIADGIAVKNPGDITLDIINKYVDDVVCVSESDISKAILHLLERNKFMVEPAGAVSVAYFLSCKDNLKGKKIVCILSGGNIDVNIIGDVIDRALTARFRKIELNIKVPKRPNNVNKVINILINSGVKISTFTINNQTQYCEIDHDFVFVVCDIMGKEQGLEIIKKLTENGYEVNSPLQNS